MTDDQKQVQGRNDEHGDVRGRTNNSQNPAFEQKDKQNDISNVDQQEGNMENGEGGADVTPAKQNDSL